MIAAESCHVNGRISPSKDHPSMSDTAPPVSAIPSSDRAIPHDHGDGFKVDPTDDDSVDAKLAAIEMAGEEVAIGWKPASHPTFSPEVRFLHASRTIHQLITDRNRSVGIFLLVASVLINASTGLLGTQLTLDPILPMQTIRYWCLPVTFGTLAVLGVFTSLLLIRTRIGLIYEVTKMNVLLGLPSKRVERVNPLSIFYLMHLMVAVLGGASAGFTLAMLVGRQGTSTAAAMQGTVAGVAYGLLFQALYYITVLRATTETKLEAARG
jgi:hypothetical protein